MAQFGKNSGAHHVTIYGVVSSVVNKKNYSSDEVFKHDNAALGVLAFTHQKCLTLMPSEIVDQHLSDLAAAGYCGDGMAADSIPEGHLNFL